VRSGTVRCFGDPISERLPLRSKRNCRSFDPLALWLRFVENDQALQNVDARSVRFHDLMDNQSISAATGCGKPLRNALQGMFGQQ
jgi:hypothetical protein